MTGRGLDHLIEQNETDLGFLSAYGGGESPEELHQLIQQVICKEMKIKVVEDGVLFSLTWLNFRWSIQILIEEVSLMVN